MLRQASEVTEARNFVIKRPFSYGRQSTSATRKAPESIVQLTEFSHPGGTDPRTA